MRDGEAIARSDWRTDFPLKYNLLLTVADGNGMQLEYHSLNKNDVLVLPIRPDVPCLKWIRNNNANKLFAMNKFIL